MADITYDRIRKVYPDGTVTIPRFDLKIEDGEFMVLVGPSGCGKSTALRMTAGLEEISGGRICIGDEVVNGKAPQQRDIAMVFQDYALYPHMTVAQNMGFALRMMKLPKDEVNQPRRRGRRPAVAHRAARPHARRTCPAVSASGSRWAAPSSASRRRS